MSFKNDILEERKEGQDGCLHNWKALIKFSSRCFQNSNILVIRFCRLNSVYDVCGRNCRKQGQWELQAAAIGIGEDKIIVAMTKFH
jgi:hypothetical protein